VPDASVAINIAASFTYYYLAPDAGTYFWHCHITAARAPADGDGGAAVRAAAAEPGDGLLSMPRCRPQQRDLRTACRRPGDGAIPAVTTDPDILCSNPVPVVNTGAAGGGKTYAYNDGDGSTLLRRRLSGADARLRPELPLRRHDVQPGRLRRHEGEVLPAQRPQLPPTRSTPIRCRHSRPMVSITSRSRCRRFIKIAPGQRALLRISNLNVSEYQTLASLGVPMQVVGYNAKLLRDQAGNNLYYTTNSITLGGGESLDVILDSCAVRSVLTDPSSSCTTPMPTGTYYLYTPNLDHLSNERGELRRPDDRSPCRPVGERPCSQRLSKRRSPEATAACFCTAFAILLSAAAQAAAPGISGSTFNLTAARLT